MCTPFRNRCRNGLHDDMMRTRGLGEPQPSQSGPKAQQITLNPSFQDCHSAWNLILTTRLAKARQGKRGIGQVQAGPGSKMCVPDIHIVTASFAKMSTRMPLCQPPQMNALECSSSQTRTALLIGIHNTPCESNVFGVTYRTQ